MGSIVIEFRPGRIFNKLKRKIKLKNPVKTESFVRVPARINAMVFDTATLVNPTRKGVYSAGELLFSAKLYTFARVKLVKGSKILVDKATKRKSIVLHTAIVMKKTLGFKLGLEIEANNLYDYPHCGFGSSAAVQIAVAMAINDIFGNPLSPEELMKLLSQNYGEEIEGESNRLIHVQSNGGGLAAALYKGGMIVLAGEGIVILRKPIPNNYSFVFGIPKSYRPFDAKTMMKKEERVFSDMKRASELNAKDLAWIILHKLLPALAEQRLFDIGECINTKFKTGSLENDSKLWPELMEKMKLLKIFRCSSTPIISYSSCGPAIFALTSNPARVKEIFRKAGLNIFAAEADNDGAIFSG
ncbi:Beta-ribofuranosylaminobenzene 5'-phosphate synthase [uncultured archaeon]|nr:Beta-ribofuranosylaminobenzene 5'-phosphate synthase [uncultured archaeon]